ncbi:MAG: hypothetical protein E6H79_06555 [Betaproteobacteria bacterium]|nr:MAG: hypothetical protein E6H79_06555 [Betaproteobacteria bacterium]
MATMDAKGTNERQGKKILAQSGLPIIAANDMAEAAEKVVAAAKLRRTMSLEGSAYPKAPSP